MAKWSPKGDRIVFQSDRLGINNLYQKAVAGGDDELLLSNGYIKIPSQWSRDGRFIVYTQTDPNTRRDVWVLPMEGAKAGQPFPFLHSEFNEFLGQLSPDSHWMAYTSDESGRREVYVRPFPSGQGQWNISLNGGEQPHWRADGKELFFIAVDGKMMAAEVKSSGKFEPGPPHTLFDANEPRPPNEPTLEYDVTADGKRFVINTALAGANAATLNLVANWQTGSNK
ncbi:MAG TPA: hypothetical protein VIY49_19440 [Bryobacteraceae bacterium]